MENLLWDLAGGTELADTLHTLAEDPPSSENSGLVFVSEVASIHNVKSSYLSCPRLHHYSDRVSVSFVGTRRPLGNSLLS